MTPKPNPKRQLWLFAVPGRVREAYEAADAAGTLDRWRRACRTTIRVLAIITLPLFVAQILAFASFIYEEALQATGYAVKIAVEANDASIARDAIDRYRLVMLDAQQWQRRYGKLAFWTHGAYYHYFFQAAPTQLACYHAAGVHRGLWAPDIDRWQIVHHPDGGYTYLDTWRMHAIAKANETLAGPWHKRLDAAADGYDPLLKHPPGSAPTEDGTPNWERRHRQ